MQYTCVIKKLLSVSLLLVLVAPLAAHAAAGKQKVLLDTDMVEMFDDGVAMTMLANAPGIDLLGVTTVTGNSWVQEGTAYTLRQMAFAKKHVPVAEGCVYPLRPQRHALFEQERKQFGMGHDSWLGSFGRPEPKSWQDFHSAQYGSKAMGDVDKRHAVDFIIDTVRAHPNEITIAAIGPCTNLAMAIRKAPDIVPLVKRIVYMGGAFFQPGNVTPAAEFNWWADPEAAQIVVRSPFHEQIVLGLDVCEKVVFRKEHYDRLLATLGDGMEKDMLRDTFVGKMFEKDPNFTHFVWDVLVAAVLIDPSLITEEKTCNIDVNAQYGLSYGQSLAYPKFAPPGSQQARIVLDIDQKRFWDMVNDKTYWKNAR